MLVCSVHFDLHPSSAGGVPAGDGGKFGWLFKAGSQRGATLVELLTSLVVASILMVALMQSLAATSDSWTRQSKHFSSQREGRVGMRMLADDLTAMVVVPSWARRSFTQDRAGGAEGEDLGGAADERSGFILEPAVGPLDSARLAFLRATQPDEGAVSERGDLRLVMYGVALNRDGAASGLQSGSMSQKLVRREFTAAETFRRLKAMMENSTPLVREADWTALAEWRDDPAVVTTGVVAHDVIQFEVRPFMNLNNPQQQVARNRWEVPTWMDLGLRVTNRQTGQWLESQQDWRGEGVRSELLINGTPRDYSDDAEVRTYTARVMLPANTL
jgi:hypothetical protein